MYIRGGGNIDMQYMLYKLTLSVIRGVKGGGGGESCNLTEQTEQGEFPVFDWSVVR